MNNMHPLVYDWASFTLNNGESDYDVATNIAALFNNVPVANNMVIFFDKQISIKMNSTLMPKALMPISRSPFQSPVRFLDIKNIFLSNASGENATIEVWLW